MKYNTGNPIGSNSPKDLNDNAINFDEAANSRTSESWFDRFGFARKTLYGMEQQVQEFLLASGYVVIGDYASGLEITAYNQIFRYDDEFYRAGPNINLPYTLTGIWGDESEYFLASGNDSLRQELAESGDFSGSHIVGFLANGLNAKNRNSQEKLRELPSVKDYGALGDGISSDINSIVDQISEFGFARFTFGEYLIDGNIVLDAPLYFEQGASLILQDGFTLTINGAIESPRQNLLRGGGQYIINDNVVEASWFNEDFEKAFSASKKVRGTPGITYAIESPMYSIGKDVLIDASESTFLTNSADTLFGITGGWSSEQNVTAISGNTFSVSDGLQYSKGDIVKIFDEDPMPMHPTGAKKGEFCTVSSVTATTVTFASQTYESYTPSSNCKIAKISPCIVDINIGVASMPKGSIASNWHELVIVEAVENPSVYIGRIPYAHRGCAVLLGCYGGKVNIGVVESAGVVSGSDITEGYGIVFFNSENCYAHIDSFNYGRHAVDGISSQRGTGASRYGYSAHNVVSGSASYCGSTGFNTHHGTYNWTFRNIKTYRCAGHCAFRGIGHKQNGGESVDDYTVLATFQQSGIGSAVTNNSYFSNVVARGAKGPLFQSSGAAGDVEIVDCDLQGNHPSTEPIFSRLFTINSTNGETSFRRSRISEIGTISLRILDIGNIGITGLNLEDLTFDLSKATLLSTFRIIDNNNGASIIFRASNIRVYSSTNISEFFRASSLPLVGSRIGNLNFERLTAITTSLVVSGDRAVAAWQPMINGPIVIGFSKIADAA